MVNSKNTDPCSEISNKISYIITNKCIKYIEINISKVREICDLYRHIPTLYKEYSTKILEAIDKPYSICIESVEKMKDIEPKDKQGPIEDIENSPHFEELYLGLRKFSAIIDTLSNIRSKIYRTIIPLLSIVIIASMISYIIYVIPHISSIVDIVILSIMLSAIGTTSISMSRYIYRSLPLLTALYLFLLIDSTLFKQINIYVIAVLATSIATYILSIYKITRISLK